eukprot:scaffold65021_cov87-Cyclotella_meneghiniana.AAC.16
MWILHSSSPFYNGLPAAPSSTDSFSGPGGHFDPFYRSSYASTPVPSHDGQHTSYHASCGPPSGSRLFPNARAPSPGIQSHGHHDVFSPAMSPGVVS